MLDAFRLTNKSTSDQNSKTLINFSIRSPKSKKPSKAQFTVTLAMITPFSLSTPKTHLKPQVSKAKISQK
jgi:hypothetical protein